MKKRIFIILSIVFVSCSDPEPCPSLVYDPINKNTSTSKGELYTGRCIVLENGKKIGVNQFINGIDYGKWVFYHSNGKIKTKGRFNLNGKKIGKWSYYHENGEIMQISRYSKDGLRKGRWVKYDKKGNKIEEVNY